MKLGIYSVKDTKVAFMQPFYMQNDNIAQRSFANTINDENVNEIGRNYQDMELWKLGEFDDETGLITANVEFLTNGINVKGAKKCENSTAKPTDQ